MRKLDFSADGNYEVRYKSNVLIYPDGEVLWIPPAIYQVFHQHHRFHHHQISYYLSNCNHGAFQSSCTIDVTYFPFDQQTCIMKFGSWTFTGDQVFTPIMFIMIYNAMPKFVSNDQFLNDLHLGFIESFQQQEPCRPV